MGMIYGQELDLEYETKTADKTVLNTIHRHKTGKMISVCGTLGSIDTALTEKKLKALNLFFENIGLVFQIVDDILDVVGDEKELGKPIGSDADSNKSTYVSILGIEESKKLASELTNKAIDSLGIFGADADFLRELANSLINRKN